MEAILLNDKFEAIDVIDTYVSFIWNVRFDEPGDFELCLSLSKGIPSGIKKGYYLCNPESDRVMIIETLAVESDEESGANFIVSGRSLGSILGRRIVWKQNAENKLVYTKFLVEKKADGSNVEYNLQDAIEVLLNENVINPDISVRKIDNFVFERSTDPKITELTINAEYLGEDLLTIIQNQCKENEIGFKVTLNENNQFVFKLIAGVDRSYEQLENPYVIFSPEFENLLNSSYVDSDKPWKNVALVAGEEKGNGKENIRDLYVEGDSGVSGLERREVFTDAGNVQSIDGDTPDADEYFALLRQKGIDTLIENTYVQAFEGEIDPNNSYVYGVDYFIGDIVQIVNEYGQEGRAYISEFVMSSDNTGSYAYPTFKTIEKEVYET